jgi:hypothetical protein
MLLCDEILFISSALRDGDCPSYHQQLASRRLVRIADDLKRLEEMADALVGDAQDEAALLAEPLRRKPAFRLVV